MTTADDLLRKVLETPNTVWFEADWAKLNEEIRAYLDAPNDEPTAWMLPSGDGYDSNFRDHSTVKSCTGNPWTEWVPLYLHPPTKAAPKKPLDHQAVLEKAVSLKYGKPEFMAAFMNGVEFAERHHASGGGE